MPRTQHTILIVEDVAPIRDALHQKLASAGFRVLEARDGDEGLSLALEKHPDLLLLDLLMPKMDGMTVLNKLREDSWGKTVKVIILTNLNENEKVADSLHAGAYDYLVKTDLSLADVVERVRTRLGMVK